jgi:hypothetical protein
VRIEWKPAVILLITLALGMALGLVVRGTVTGERDRRAAELRTAPGFESLVMEVIEPRETQEDSIRPILEASAHRYDSLVGAARSGLGLVLDSMKRQLAPLLDARQRERLSRMTTLPDPNRRRPPPGERPRDSAGSPRAGPPPRDQPARAARQPQGDQPPREAGPPRDQPPRAGGPPPGDPPPRAGAPPQDRPPRPGAPTPGGRPPADRPGGPPPDRPPPAS